ncbi:carbon-nitrogen hydrolase family protein [Paenibacillus koleovorans]|uniref:carbon-nitrogen hydrolase family protein n=1 Tax=Paenibacillus koleovorans TaxID=121608 RepID=UPI000FD7E38D|nr:carbon-nitrogen hydrolase family protein [Paenibacillus koleovorans]
MARLVKISCLGPPPYHIDPEVPYELAVERMKAHWQRELDRVLPDRPDLIVLPEACDRPYYEPVETRNAFYRVRGNQIRDLLAENARRHHCYITYPAHIELADGTWRNSLQLIDRQGNVAGTYHKNHLVPVENTVGGLSYGHEVPLVETDFGRVAFAICFDLNFDELRLKIAGLKPDLIVFASLYHGGLMQAYWAYSCRAHFAGAVANLPCTILSPTGEQLASSTNYYPFLTAVVNLDCAVVHIDENGRQFQAIKNKYGAGVTIADPGLLGSVLLTSEMEHVTALDVVEEFGLLRLDDYFTGCLEHRRQFGASGSWRNQEEGL